MPISFMIACLSLTMPTCNNAITTEQIFMKFEIRQWSKIYSQATNFG